VALSEAVGLARKSLPDSHGRIDLAQKIVIAGDVRLHVDGTATVGSASEAGTAYYVVGEACTCPDYERAPSHYCKHRLAHALLRRAQRLLEEHESRAWAGQDLEADASPLLPLPPTTADERLAHIPHSMPLKEPTMPEDPDGYIPEPAPQDAREAQALTPVVTPGDDLETALETWTIQRAIVQRFLKQQLVAGVDYYTLRFGKEESKPTLSKAGAEKVLSWLRWSASFAPDTGTWEMLGRPTDLVCYVCTLHTRGGEVVGEGRGARSIKKDNGDINKAIKMAEKSSMVSAVLRTGALSDCFTQDTDDQDLWRQ